MDMVPFLNETQCRSGAFTRSLYNVDSENLEQVKVNKTQDIQV